VSDATHTSDGLYRADFHVIAQPKVQRIGNPAPPFYHLVLIRLADNRAIADTRKTGHEAWLPTPNAMRFDINSPFAGDRHIAIDLTNSTCGEENFREPTGPLADLRTLLS